jgi:2-phospho-L-lactate guanylyltransferase
MALWSIVPVKPLQSGKSRLSDVLTNDERIALNTCLLSNTLDTLMQIEGIEHILVVSRDPKVLAVARKFGARTVQENGASNLNAALTLATVVAKQHTALGILILPADLPLLTQEDIYTLIKFAQDPPVVVIVPDYRRQGTNALLVSPAGLIEYEFGPGSFQRHCERAQAAGARLVVCELPAMSLDVDLPEDLERIEQEFDCLSAGK